MELSCAIVGTGVIAGFHAEALAGRARIVAATDMLATVPDRLARYFAASLAVRVHKLPIPLDDPTILMIWSERTHRDPAHRWIRQLVRESALQATQSSTA